MSENRIARRFAALKREDRAGLLAFVTAGDPDAETSRAITAALPKAGADVIELGMPFSDPMADGPAIQAAGLRALKAGQTQKRTLQMVRDFRTGDAETPVVLMGYFNPILQYGVERFCVDAAAAGVDGLIIVDLPMEEADAMDAPARANGIAMIQLVAPTTPEDRLAKVVANASGFVYAVAVTGTTGKASATEAAMRELVDRVRRHTTLPVVVGFGIKTPANAATVARIADGAAVGTSIVQSVAAGLDAHGQATPGLVDGVVRFVASLADGMRGARVKVDAR